MSRIVIAAAACALACSGSQKQIEIKPPPPPHTRATLAGPLCGAGTVCTCRDENASDDGGAGKPDDSRKRFELKLGPTEHDLWVQVDDQVLFKSKEHPTDCFYLDLAPGEHKVLVRAHNPNSVQAAVSISEFGPAAASWYRTFRFACNGICDQEDFDAAKADYAQYKGGIHDPCGSVRVKSLVWDTGVAPDHVHPEDVALWFVLDVYKFKPGKATGDSTCGEGRSAAGQDEAPTE